MRLCVLSQYEKGQRAEAPKVRRGGSSVVVGQLAADLLDTTVAGSQENSGRSDCGAFDRALPRLHPLDQFYHEHTVCSETSGR